MYVLVHTYVLHVGMLLHNYCWYWILWKLSTFDSFLTSGLNDKKFC